MLNYARYYELDEEVLPGDVVAQCWGGHGYAFGTGIVAAIKAGPFGPVATIAFPRLALLNQIGVCDGSVATMIETVEVDVDRVRQVFGVCVEGKSGRIDNRSQSHDPGLSERVEARESARMARHDAQFCADLGAS